MIAFSTTTAFWLVGRLVMGKGSAGIYLLIYEEGTQFAIEADLQAEVEVQMGRPLPIGRVSELLDVEDGLGVANAGLIRVLRIDRWSPDLVALLDTHVIRLERSGAQFLFLTTLALAEQLLKDAPNFRNRLTEILQIVPDDLSGGGPH